MDKPLSTAPTSPGGSRRPPQTRQKLKDTCDMCSASKVKCSKEKPVCARCEKLGYPCFYSPARRMGRPHPPRKSVASAQRSSNPASPELSARSWVRSNDEAELRPDGQRPAKRRSIGSMGISSRQSEVSSNDNNSENQSNNSTFQPSPRTDNLDFQNFILPQDLHVNDLDDTGVLSFDDDLSRVSTNDMDSLLFTPEESTFQFQSTPKSTSNMNPYSMSLFKELEMPPNSAATGLNASINNDNLFTPNVELDCATVAMGLLQKLNDLASLCRSTATDSPPPATDMFIKTITSSTKRISTILVCPCSSKMEVGLLAAAVCAAILDVYELVLRKQSQCDASSSKVNQTSSNGANAEESNDSNNPSRNTTMRILEELPQMANLVIQFARRYSRPGAVESSSANFLLPSLASSLKARLKSLTHEATNQWLVLS
ncbi:hypothetical protein VTN49DRAFT_5108 [Thermomyces lanuginosus]|uniref:uncharacterized protein n=1 Tax=Thermomyces lanuginosus TaxID=5541 RepID=UPI003742C1D9